MKKKRYLNSESVNFQSKLAKDASGKEDQFCVSTWSSQQLQEKFIFNVLSKSFF